MGLKNFACGLLLGFSLSSAAYAQLDNGKIAFRKGDYEVALKVWGAKAERGDAVGQNGLGLLYFNGLGVPQDVEQGLAWFRKAADQNNPNAQYNLGRALF